MLCEWSVPALTAQQRLQWRQETPQWRSATLTHCENGAELGARGGGGGVGRKVWRRLRGRWPTKQRQFAGTIDAQLAQRIAKARLDGESLVQIECRRITR